MIEVRNLCKAFGRREVIKNLDLTFASGTITGIAGPNACGKTTLLKCILGLTIPTAGEIYISGKRVDPQGEFRRQIGYMPQHPNFPRNLNVGELLTLFDDLRGEKAPLREELVDYFELRSVVRQASGELSGGTKQKLSAVIAFMFDSPIIILDEPTAGLDPLMNGKFKDLVTRKARSGATIVMVSHFMSELANLAQHLIFLTEGELIYAGTLGDLYVAAEGSDLDHALKRLFEKRKRGDYAR